MREYILKDVAKSISDSYYDVLLVGFEEEKEKFVMTMLVVDFMVNLKEKGVVLNMDDIFIDKFIDKMYVEAEKYIGK